MLGENIVEKSAALRGQGRFDEAIQLIESNIDTIDESIKVIALLEAFKAAREKGDMDQARRYASLIGEKEPGMPSIQSFL